jgi:G3E family GTPase
VVDGALNPIDQIETFKAWLEAQGGELARVLCVVNSQLAEKHIALLAWFEACVHFSDIVLLNKREGLENKWLSDFLAHFKKQYYPCVFEMVRDGKVKNPALILEPQARRMSHLFDEEQDWIFTNAEGEEIDEQEESEDGEDEIEAKQEEDPYLVRRNGGRRVKELPDIAEYL